MGIDLIIAMVIAAAGVKAWEQRRDRSKARWEEAKRRAAEASARREQEKQQRAAEWDAKVDQALSQGPRHPLWWAFAAGYLLAGAITAVGAGAVGAVSGAIEGARGGYAVGREGGRQGWKFAEAFGNWRRQNPSRPIELARCERCQGWITADQLTKTVEFGRVCPDCVPGRASEPDPETHEPAEDSDPWFESTVVHDRNDADEPQKPRCQCGALAPPDRELCWSCLMREADYWDRVAEQGRKHAQGEHDKPTNGRRNSEARCWGLCGRPPAPDSDYCFSCRPHQQRCETGCGRWAALDGPLCAHCQRMRSRGSGGGQHSTHQTKQGQESQQTEEKPDPIRVSAERIYPEPEQKPQPKEIENMNALPAGTSSDLATTGEGFSDTISTLTGLSSFLQKAFEAVTELGDNLAANSLDSHTLGEINELMDLLETAAPKAADLLKHVEHRHAPVAAAMAEAGGSQNVATKSWYDDL